MPTPDALPRWVYVLVGFAAGFAAGWLVRGDLPPDPPAHTSPAQHR